MDKVVVIGGAGFIGRTLTAQLAATGASVTVVSRSAGSRAQEGSVRYLSGQIADAERMMEVIDGADVVYDLTMSLGARWEDYERDYIGGARNVARACLRLGVRRLLYTSSISALFLGTGKPVTEADGTDRKPLARSFYGRAKILAERALMELHSSEKLPVVIFRPGIVLGPGGMLAHGALGEIVDEVFVLGFGSGTHPLPCVLVEDVASALVLGKDAPNIEGQAFNLAGDVKPTAVEYVEEIRQRTRRNFRFVPRSVWSVGFAERLRWLIKAVARKPDNVCGSYRDVQSLSMSSDLDCSLAKRLLGWTPVCDREEFVRRAIEVHLRPIPAGDLRLPSQA